MTPNETKIYDEAKACLGTHVTLNPAVPAEVGCVEAVSYVLKNAGITGIPAEGIENTTAFFNWLSANPHFERIFAPEQGAIIVSYGMGLNGVEGHTGILGALGAETTYEYGIMSNNSNTGLFSEVWNLLTWWENWGIRGGLPVTLFRAL